MMPARPGMIVFAGHASRQAGLGFVPGSRLGAVHVWCCIAWVAARSGSGFVFGCTCSTK
jgi:hypothetical protein